MSNLHESEVSKWYESLDEARADGLFPVKCTSLMQFYKLRGRASVICKENFEPITYLPYVYFSPEENRYYWKVFPYYGFDDFYFFRPLLDFGQNELIKTLRDRVLNGHGVWLLFNAHQIGETSKTLERIWNSQRSDKGKLGYKDYLVIAELCIKLEDYKEVGKNLTGYKTVCNQFETQIKEFWKEVKPNTK